MTFFSTARSILGSDDEALDCVHDALLQAWRRASEYRSEQGSLLSHLLTYVSNEAKLCQKSSSEQQRSPTRLGATMAPEQNDALEGLCRRISVSAQGAEGLPASGWIEQIKQDFSAAAPWLVGGALLLALGTLSIGDVKLPTPMSRNDTALSTIAHRRFLQKPLIPHAPGAPSGEATYDPDGHWIYLMISTKACNCHVFLRTASGERDAGSLEAYGDVSTFYLADLQGLTSARLARSEDGVTLASVKLTYKKAR